MIIKVAQINSNGENLFEVSNQSGVIYYAKAPWLKLRLPFKMENLRTLNMTNRNGEVVYTTSYSVVENQIETMLPMKFLWSSGQKFSRYAVIQNGECRGAFYSRQDGVWDDKLVVESNGRFIIGYDKCAGKIRAISLYENEHQIGQITKPLATIGNLDNYYIHLLDEHVDLIPILSFFCYLL